MSKSVVYVAQVSMVTLECCGCHIIFGIPKEFYDECDEKKQGKSFFCPNGHEQHFIGKSEEDKLRDRLIEVQSCCDKYQDKVVELEYKIPRMIGGYRAQLKRAKAVKEE